MKNVIFSFALLLAVSPALTQTVDDVINKHIEAMGGKDKLNSIKSIYTESVSVMQNGNEMNSKTYKVDKSLYRRDVDFGMGSFTSIVTDKEGWASNPRSGGAFEPMAAADVLAQQYMLDCAGPMVDYTAKGHKAELIGKDSVNGKACYKVKLTLKTGNDITYCIDSQTGYVLQLATKGGGMMRRPGADPNAEIRINFDDYKKTADGYFFPFATSVQGMGASTQVEKIEVNKTVDAKLFKPEK